MTFTVPFEKVRQHTEREEISSVALIRPFREPDAYRAYANFDTLTGISVLDKQYKSTGAVNFNHIGYIPVSKKYYSAACNLISKYPNYYAHSIAKAFYTYLRPCADSKIISGNNRRKMNVWVDFYEKYLVGDIMRKIWKTKYVNRFGQQRTIHINFLYVFIPIIYIWGIIVSIRGRKMLLLKKSELHVLQYIMFNIIYITVIGNLIEVGENMRFRFLVLPLIYILMVTMITYFSEKSRLT
jgi:hypothetical protein